MIAAAGKFDLTDEHYFDGALPWFRKMGNIMEKLNIDGMPYVVVRGQIEATGGGVDDVRGAYLPTVRFDDGTILRNVYLDNASSPYFEAGTSGSFAFHEVKGKHYFLGAEIDGFGFRSADVVGHAQVARRTQTITTVSVVVAGALLYLGYQANWVAALAIGGLPTLFALWSMTKSGAASTQAKLVSLIAAAKGIRPGQTQTSASAAV
jgi:hypothetical protein